MKDLKVVASIEARMSSSRLPGKVLKDLCGKPVIGWLVDRLKSCHNIDEVIVATSTSQKDDILVDWCLDNNINYYRGSEDDVLKRVVEAHRKVETDIIVELTGDCPLTDPETVDLAIEMFLANDCDYLANCVVPSYPQGICVQVFRFRDLEVIDRNTNDPAIREHVSLDFYESKEKYRNLNLLAPHSFHLPSDCRTQLDYEEDLHFLREVCGKLVPEYGYNFNLLNLVALLKKEPDLININRHCIERSVR